tara:strand:+ start:12356 stop:12976 length:621 start_codon:yes stop_codon:yes gene_type:complete
MPFIGVGTTKTPANASVDTAQVVDEAITAGKIDPAVSTAGSMTLTHTFTITSGATVDLDGIFSADYDAYHLVFIDVLPVTDATYSAFRFGTGGTPDSSAFYNYSALRAATHNSILLGSQFTTAYTDTAGNVAGEGISFTMDVFDPFSSSIETKMIATGYYVTSAGALLSFRNAGKFAGTTSFTDISYYYVSGNTASGTVRVYGVAT